MGLFDAFQFDPNSFDGGGLLANLRQQLQSSNQPSPLDNAQWPAGPQGNYGQTQNVAVGNYQMPQFGVPQPDQAALPQAAQPAQYTPQQPAAPQPSQTFGGDSPSLSDKLLAGFTNFGAGGKSGGLIGAIAGAGTGFATGQRQDPAGLQQQQLSATFQSLVSSGVPKNLAMAATLNPKVLETIAPQYFSKPELKLVKDGLGADQPYVWDATEQTLKPVGGGQNGSGGSFNNGVSLLAPGVKQFDSSLTGEDYLKQFGPEVQAAAKAYINGDVLPSGNPRNQAIATKAKEIAQKYGQDMGIPVSDALYSQKRTYMSQLGSNSPSAVGGQAKAFNQGIDHLTHLATTLEKLDNSNGFGIPMVAGVVNSGRQGMSTELSAISDEAKSLGQTVAGEVGKLFSGSAGGGVHERELTRDRFDTVKSKPQLAAALRATLETMDGGLRALEVGRDRALGPNSNVNFVDQTTKDNIAKIQDVITRLEKGDAPAKAQSAAAPDRSAIEAEMRRRGLMK